MSLAHPTSTQVNSTARGEGGTAGLVGRAAGGTSGLMGAATSGTTGLVDRTASETTELLSQGAGATSGLVNQAAGRTNGFLGRVRGLLFTPRTEWFRIARETGSSARLMAGYVIPLAVLAPAVALVRAVLGFHDSYAHAVLLALLTFSLELLSLQAVALIVNTLATSFHGQPNWRLALRVVSYAYTPVWIMSVFVPFFPGAVLALQVAAGLFHTYLMYLGAYNLMKAPRDRALGYATTVVLSSLILGIVLMRVTAAAAHLLHVSHYHAFG